MENTKKKEIAYKLIILTIISVLSSSCDPINCGIVENKSDKEVEFRLFVKDINEIINPETFQIDTGLKCGKIILKPEEEFIVAFGSRIAAAVMKEDLKFDKVEIIFSNDTLIFNKSAFYYCMNDRIDWPFFAVKNRYFTIK